jgi:uncharacterized damage-inducible protein DinB
MKTNEITAQIQNPAFITPEALLEHWQGHRRVTRKLIEAFPEEKLFTYSVGGMRPFSELALEMITMAVPGVRGALTGKWQNYEEANGKTKEAKTREDILRLWDESTDQLNLYWPQIPSGRFLETDLAFGQWEGTIYWIILYFIDNEIHHRGQGYVYLRSLGIEPPFFWDRK